MRVKASHREGLVGCKSGERPLAPHDKTRRTAVFRGFFRALALAREVLLMPSPPRIASQIGGAVRYSEMDPENGTSG